MAINKNHEFEDLNGVKCAIVEKNASPERAEFLKQLLEANNYAVVVLASPPPKAAAAPAPKPVAEGEVPAPAPPPPPPSSATFTVGVTDVTFNATNAIFGRMLRTADNKVITLAYWKQEETIPTEEIPYFMKG
jgi:hypothetical protein